MNIQRTRGLIAAPFTPFSADGSVDLSMIRPYANWLQSEGVSGAFVCGTTGEGFSLSIDERCHVAEAWVEAVSGGMRVIVHVGHNSLKESRRLAAHAASAGAHAIATMPPFFFKPAGMDGLLRWCEEVASAAPQLPFYFYHIPSMSGVELRVSEFLPLAAKAIPNFAGIKFTYEDLVDFKCCLEWAGERYDILFGRDELLLSALRIGATGAVGSTYNYAAPLYLKLMDAYAAGDGVTAEQLQAEAVRMIDICIKGPWHPLAAFKWLVSQVAVECGPTRLPISPLTPEQVATLEAQFAGYIATRSAQLLPLNS